MTVINSKHNKKMSICLLAMLLVGVAACTDHFDSLNTPKDEIVAEEVDGSLLGQAFAQAQFTGMFGEDQSFQRFQALFSDLYAQYFATTAAFFHSDQYTIPGPWTEWAFDEFYESPAPQLLFVEEFTEDPENDMAVENAMAKIWRVAMYHRMTDFWGPIPYTHYGSAETSIPYDSQEDIYMDFFETLDEAVAVLEANPGVTAVYGSHDQIYNGSADQWLTFANSLRLRLALRVVYAEPELAQTEAEKAVAAGVMLDNSDNADLETTINSINPYDTITAWGEFRMSATMQSTLEGFEDPRLPIYFDEVVQGGGYKGLRNGLDPVDKGGDIDERFSNIAPAWQRGGTNPPIYVMPAAEVYFLRAEGDLWGWDMGGSAEDLYNEGIRLSMEYHTEASASEINDYITSTDTPVALNDEWNTPAMSDIPVAYLGNGDFEKAQEQIITQKWLALYPNSVEAWAERRRTGYPVGFEIIASQNPDIGVDETIRRLPFVTTEYSNNNAAVMDAVELLDGDDTASTRLWWDQKEF